MISLPDRPASLPALRLQPLPGGRALQQLQAAQLELKQDVQPGSPVTSSLLDLDDLDDLLPDTISGMDGLDPLADILPWPLEMPSPQPAMRCSPSPMSNKAHVRLPLTEQLIEASLPHLHVCCSPDIILEQFRMQPSCVNRCQQMLLLVHGLAILECKLRLTDELEQGSVSHGCCAGPTAC